MQPPDSEDTSKTSPKPGELLRIWPPTKYESFEAGQQRGNRQCCAAVAGCCLLLALLYGGLLFVYHWLKGG